MPRHEAERTVDGQGHFNVTKATVTSLPLCPTVVTNLYHKRTVMVLQNTPFSCTVSPAVETVCMEG
jgi:hypothetical protein